MILDKPGILDRIKKFDFTGLFTQELGWDFPPAKQKVAAAGQTFALRAVAEKRGFVVYECPAPDGTPPPNSAVRRMIDRQLGKVVREHLIIFTDAKRTLQVWQWVRRELGRPVACREQTYYVGHSGEALFQRLAGLAVALAEEDKITLTDTVSRVRAAFDVDRVTKRFYDRFKTEHARFLDFIKGITAQGDREWYASLMLNRLMFVYFIQKQRFLDGEPDYLRKRLQMVRRLKGKDKFHTFYRYFLLRLFHEGLGQPEKERKKDLETLLGKVPYLNGGLFDVHELEHANPDITIADEAFERLFDFFDGYKWHLDERPLRADNEINPDVLGYIFEKYINQKQMGAYYTKEDITGYIARNTLLPFILQSARKKNPAAFQSDGPRNPSLTRRVSAPPVLTRRVSEGDGPVWRLLRDDPDRYICAAVRHGVDVPLPKPIAAGIDDVAKRDGWNKPAPAEFALPTETWREHVARRQRCLDLRAKLKAGEVHDANDLITYNLDIEQFVEDVVDSCDSPDLLRALYHAIANVSVLDPTCGSGAFLFAALNILEPLYDGCLDRMQALLDDLDRAGSPAPTRSVSEGEVSEGPVSEGSASPSLTRRAGADPAEKHHPQKYADFRKVLAEVARHPSRRYFILKSIIIGNLYGVDIMEEAVEICKLRLFLKLVAQIDKVADLEPLPDIDFNIRAGNTLVGFVSLQEVKKSLEGKLSDLKENVKRITEEAEIVDRAFQQFRHMQTEFGMDAKKFSAAKVELRGRLEKLPASLTATWRLNTVSTRTNLEPMKRGARAISPSIGSPSSTAS